MRRDAKLDRDGVDRRREPWIEQQCPEEGVLLLEPMRFPESDDRGGVEQR